ncbi:Monocyte to macrophage differentiation factor 2 [Amphibalanus amphitrite]|uniref:Monocyte to macrophage differentiation factor 2 n=1 Tax=Amphibalanus amphitrite TaxID=1232801 RepID=A0A6A4VSZ4_AMPAM|nr:monocyte to macrophage differentiation factor 2-like [Amphibalanus amphitrite]KAF0299236.1 Monocyte to macrophage differentiation factor 2 [Amphibalanus amphitrite]KAF0299237.1 Monocyte to macrophage differentiation factor 2 [Amphibalanus amphitrite]
MVKGHSISTLQYWLLDVKHNLRQIKWKNERGRHGEAYKPTDVEHIANIITHGVWILPSIFFALSLYRESDVYYEAYASVIYGSALILLFSVSTVFHLISFAYRDSFWRDVFHRLDRGVIYFFIASSYTPWLVLKEVPDSGWSVHLRWAIWILAGLGVLYQQLFHERYKWLETLIYLVIAIAPSLCIYEMTDVSGVTELKYGGLVYVLGVVFFKLDGRLPMAHAVWHLFVVVGATIHYQSVMTYLLEAHVPKPWANGVGGSMDEL